MSGCPTIPWRMPQPDFAATWATGKTTRVDRQYVKTAIGRIISHALVWRSPQNHPHHPHTQPPQVGPRPPLHLETTRCCCVPSISDKLQLMWITVGTGVFVVVIIALITALVLCSKFRYEMIFMRCLDNACYFINSNFLQSS